MQHAFCVVTEPFDFSRAMEPAFLPCACNQLARLVAAPLVVRRQFVKPSAPSLPTCRRAGRRTTPRARGERHRLRIRIHWMTQAFSGVESKKLVHGEPVGFPASPPLDRKRRERRFGRMGTLSELDCMQQRSDMISHAKPVRRSWTVSASHVACNNEIALQGSCPAPRQHGLACRWSCFSRSDSNTDFTCQP